MKRLHTLLRDENGFASAEFGAISAFLVICTIGVIDVGNMVRASMRTKYAAAAGASYAFRNGFDAAAISSAVAAATSGFGVSATPGPSQFYGCATSTGVTTVADGTTPCSGTTVLPGVYVKVQAQSAFSPFFNASVLSYPTSLNATATVRIK